LNPTKPAERPPHVSHGQGVGHRQAGIGHDRAMDHGHAAGNDQVEPPRAEVHGTKPPEYLREVEDAWLLKSTMQWARDDRGPFKALRWRAWDRFGVGHPPSRAVNKSTVLDEDRSVGRGTDPGSPVPPR
jgi:hypothetical protein